jgi:hypothetical protein
MAAGATLGSNHNSRGADGELQTGRGFWPGLSVALKHNSKFASFNLISKGNYPAEIHNPIPFSLLGNDDQTGGLLIIAGYWFQYNMYAIARNAWKFAARDQRVEKNMLLEFDYLAPDTVSEILEARDLFCQWVGDAIGKDAAAGKAWLENPANEHENLNVWATGIENTKRKTRVAKVYRAYQIFGDLLHYHAAKEWVATCDRNPSQKPMDLLHKTLEKATSIQTWDNLGGQLIPSGAVLELKNSIKNGQITRWAQVHDFYEKQASVYPDQKFENALNGLLKVTPEAMDNISVWLDKAVETARFLTAGIEKSREKDYNDPFRLAMFGNAEELESVIGDLNDNEFIQQSKVAQHVFEEKIKGLQIRR